MGVADDLLVESRTETTAFETLVRQLSADVFGYLARRAPDDAEDLLAQVWAQAFASRLSFDHAKGSARAWLFGVARHVLAAHWRQANRNIPPTGTGAWGVTGSATVVDSARLPPGGVDPWPAVDDRLAAAAVAPQLRAGLHELSADEREVLLLVAWEQLTPTEAAAVLAIPPATARTRLHRARAHLRASLDPVVRAEAEPERGAVER